MGELEIDGEIGVVVPSAEKALSVFKAAREIVVSDENLLFKPLAEPVGHLSEQVFLEFFEFLFTQFATASYSDGQTSRPEATDTDDGGCDGPVVKNVDMGREIGSVLIDQGLGGSENFVIANDVVGSIDVVAADRSPSAAVDGCVKSHVDGSFESVSVLGHSVSYKPIRIMVIDCLLNGHSSMQSPISASTGISMLRVDEMISYNRGIRGAYMEKS